MMCGVKKLKDTAKPSSLILADELDKPVIKKFNKRTVYSQYIFYVLQIYLVNTHLLFL